MKRKKNSGKKTQQPFPLLSTGVPLTFTAFKKKKKKEACEKSNNKQLASSLFILSHVTTKTSALIQLFPLLVCLVSVGVSAGGPR